MVSTNITKIFFRGNEIVDLYKGDTLIFKKSGGGKSIIRGKVYDECTDENIIITYNGNKVSLNINTDKTFEYDTDEVLTNGMNMFYRLICIEKLDVSNFDTSNVTKMFYMFIYCTRLIDLYLNFNVGNTESFRQMFGDCISLTNVVGKFEGTKYDLNLASCPLTAQSAMVFINGLATVTETRTLALSATTYDSLTNEQIAIATSKGWTVTRN